MSPKQRPFDHHLNKDEEEEQEEKLPYGFSVHKVGYDSKTKEKVVLEDPSQHAASSGPTRDEAETWLKTKGLSEDEVGLIIVYVFDFARGTKPSVRAVADALAHKGREWVAQKLRQQTVREFCGIVMHCHSEGVPLPPLESVPGLPQPKEIEQFEAGLTEQQKGGIPDLRISHLPEDHPDRHTGKNSLIGCVAHAKRLLKPDGILPDALETFVNARFLGRGVRDPVTSVGLYFMFSEKEFSKEEEASPNPADGLDEFYERLEVRLYGKIARGGLSTARSLIEAITAQGIEVPQAKTEIERLNKLLSGGSLLDRFKEITLPEEAAWMVEENLPSRLAGERIRLNRLILEAAFPEQCPRNRYIRCFRRTLEEEDIVPLIRMNPSWLLQEEWRLLLEAFVDLLEGAFYGDSALPDTSRAGPPASPRPKRRPRDVRGSSGGCF